MEYTRREIGYLITVILVLAFVFGFNDGKDTFDLAYWLAHFFKILLIVAISIFIHDFAHDLMAKKYGFISEYRVWGIKRFGFMSQSFPKTINLFGRQVTIQSFPLGIVIALAVMLLSNGKAFFSAVSSYGLVIKKTHRLGRQFIEVTDFEEAKIAVAGPIACILLVVVLKMFNGSGAFDEMILINSWMAFWDMIPLPGLDGAKVFYGSKPLYVFSFLFIIGIAILSSLLSAGPALLLALAVAFFFLVGYLYRFFYAK